MTHALDFEELPIDLVTEIAQMGEVIDPFVDVEVVGVVDGRLGAACTSAGPKEGHPRP
jgi:hypothetical protein